MKKNKRKWYVKHWKLVTVIWTIIFLLIYSSIVFAGISSIFISSYDEKIYEDLERYVSDINIDNNMIYVDSIPKEIEISKEEGNEIKYNIKNKESFYVVVNYSNNQKRRNFTNVEQFYSEKVFDILAISINLAVFLTILTLPILYRKTRKKMNLLDKTNNNKRERISYSSTKYKGILKVDEAVNTKIGGK